MLEVHEAFEQIAALSGAGSQGARAAATAELFGRATAEEQPWLRGIVTGEVRQGALDSLVQEGLAAAGGVPLAAVRRAAMMAGSTVAVVHRGADRRRGGAGGVRARGRAAGAADARVQRDHGRGGDGQGRWRPDSPVAIDTKLDGIRIQVHRRGTTRSSSPPGRWRTSPAGCPRWSRSPAPCPRPTFVLDGEVLALDDQGRPRPFQETASRTAMSEGVHLTPYFFDLLHLDGRDLVDSPGSERLAALAGLVPEEHLVAAAGHLDGPARPRRSSRDVLDLGHEGVVVKNLAAPYDAGRRGSAWVKVKPVHTLDLVVLAVEWGSGRRRGWLSNIHLGARDSATTFVMLGKTFKGMTDEMLAWQTERFTELALDPAGVRDHHVVEVRPEQVVEIAFDGLQRSTRYPGGMALRFARVVRYRDDKTARPGRHHRDGARALRSVIQARERYCNTSFERVLSIHAPPAPPPHRPA